MEFPDRVLFSSDMLYGNPYLAREAVEYTIKDKTVRRMILGINFSRLLNQ
jgi:predicted TIM-barrel fold metal-dependent hydrolase